MQMCKRSLITYLFLELWIDKIFSYNDLKKHGVMYICKIGSLLICSFNNFGDLPYSRLNLRTFESARASRFSLEAEM